MAKDRANNPARRPNLSYEPTIEEQNRAEDENARAEMEEGK